MTQVHEHPTELWERVLEARELVRMERRVKGGTIKSGWELVQALEDYTGSLTRRGQPVPYQLCQELQLARLTWDH